MDGSSKVIHPVQVAGEQARPWSRALIVEPARPQPTGRGPEEA